MASLQCASAWASLGAGTPDSSVTVLARTKGHTFFTLRQLALSRLSGNAPTLTLPGIWDQGKWKRKKPHPLGWALEIAKVKKFPSPNLTLWELPVSLPRIPPPGELRLLKREEGSRIFARLSLHPWWVLGRGSTGVEL